MVNCTDKSLPEIFALKVDSFKAANTCTWHVVESGTINDRENLMHCWWYKPQLSRRSVAACHSGNRLMRFARPGRGCRLY
jgi:hypothetical protein